MHSDDGTDHASNKPELPNNKQEHLISTMKKTQQKIHKNDIVERTITLQYMEQIV